MQPDSPDPFPVIIDKTSTPKASAAELQAKYQRIKQRQRVLGIIGIVLLVALYLFLRHGLPALGRRRRPPL